MNKWRRSFKLHYMYFVALQVNNCWHFLTQLNMAKHEVNTTRNAPMCLKRSPSTNELVSSVLSQLIYLFLNVRGKWNVQPSFVQKKIPYLLKTWWFMRLFFLPLLQYIWGKKTTGLFCDIHMYSNLKEI